MIGIKDKIDYAHVLPVRGESNGISEVWQTGQKICYDLNGNTIDCINTGQDVIHNQGNPGLFQGL
jgi:hypothetical protein